VSPLSQFCERGHVDAAGVAYFHGVRAYLVGLLVQLVAKLSWSMSRYKDCWVGHVHKCELGSVSGPVLRLMSMAREVRHCRSRSRVQLQTFVAAVA
jgi:hypothetical protein